MAEKTKEEDLNFEQALSRLEVVVEKLESGNTPLADLVRLYGEGMQLKDRCDKLLKSAELKIEKIRLNTDKDEVEFEEFTDEN